MWASYWATSDPEHSGMTIAMLRGCQLIGLEDRHYAVDPRRILEPETGDVLAVADGPDEGDLVAGRNMSACPRVLDALHDRRDVLTGGGWLHDDHHRDLLFRS
jgi:hypothetical protein